MIHIEKGETLSENKKLQAASETGDYEDTALIEFTNGEDDEVVGAFQAQYVRYGSLVYRFNDPKELGLEILKIDPQSTHTAASFVRMTNELLAQMSDGSLEAASLDGIIKTEKDAITETIIPNDKKVTPVKTLPNVKTKKPPKVITVPAQVTPVSTSTPTLGHTEVPILTSPDGSILPDTNIKTNTAPASKILPVEDIPDALDDVVSYTKKRIVKIAKDNLKKRKLG